MNRYSMDPRAKSIECVKNSLPIWLGSPGVVGRCQVLQKSRFRMLFFIERGLYGVLSGAFQLSVGAQLPQKGFVRVGSLLDQTFASSSLPAFARRQLLGAISRTAIPGKLRIVRVSLG
jgi:hypothetical protein